MKKSIKLGLVLVITNLNAITYINPLGSNFKSSDNGGTMPAIDAYKDGVGAVIVDNLMTTDNSAMNTLVYTYGEAAKASGSTIVDEVMYGSGNTNVKDKVLVGKLIVDGQTCNDNNAATTGETWLNGVCQGGISTNGTACNDNNIMTINDIYTNGVCAGTLTVNGTTCNDNNSLTYGDIYTNGICSGTLITQISCKAIKIAQPSSIDGTYIIDPDGVGGNAEFNVYCDMTTKGGGWTLVYKDDSVNSKQAFYNYFAQSTDSFGTPNSYPYKMNSANFTHTESMFKGTPTIITANYIFGYAIFNKTLNLITGTNINSCGPYQFVNAGCEMGSITADYYNYTNTSFNFGQYWYGDTINNGVNGFYTSYSGYRDVWSSSNSGINSLSNPTTIIREIYLR